MMTLAALGLHISLFWLFFIGLAVGLIGGFIGVGGGFVRMPSMIYFIGVPSILAVGTDLFEIIISGAYGLIRHTMNGNVVIEISVVMLLGACIGAQIGALATRYVRGLSIRYILAYSVILSAIGSITKLVYLQTGSTISWMQTAANILTFGSTCLLMVMVLGLFIFGVMYRNGRRVPAALELYLDRAD